MPLAITGTRWDDETVGVRVEGGTIAALGPDVVAAPGDEVIDGTGLALVAGLVNGHTHAAMTLLRGFGDDLPLQQWLESVIWPAEARVTADDVYWGTRLACIEMVRSGTTRFWDMYFHSVEVGRAVADAGLRATVSQVVLEAPGAPVEVGIAAAPDALDAIAATGPRITPSLGPHSIYAVGDDALRTIAELSATRGLPVQIHLSETEAEVRDCLDAHGCRPAEHLDALGLLTERTVLAHGVWLDRAELDLVAARGATVVTNPASNMKLAVGRAFPYPDAAAAGVRVGLGTDGAASNNSLDLLADLKLLALLQKHAAQDAAVLPAPDAWAVATGANGPLLGGTPIAVGAPADFALVDLRATELAPGPLVPNLVYAASGAVVHTVVVDGRVLMHDRAIEGEDEVRGRALECARRVRG
jgi:5-methylthioadenosine/S-adenosylhomocysteine deaminase